MSGTVAVEILCRLVKVDEAEAEVLSDVLEDMEVVNVVVAEVADDEAAAASDVADKSVEVSV